MLKKTFLSLMASFLLAPAANAACRAGEITELVEPVELSRLEEGVRVRQTLPRGTQVHVLSVEAAFISIYAFSSEASKGKSFLGAIDSTKPSVLKCQASR